MYWNDSSLSGASSSPRLIETWDVLKYPDDKGLDVVILRLIETWDVLKLRAIAQDKQLLSAINRNMRCIEMPALCLLLFWSDLINRNMRCIEMLFRWVYTHLPWRLIETWDVLKFVNQISIAPVIRINRNMRCIEIFCRRR